MGFNVQHFNSVTRSFNGIFLNATKTLLLATAKVHARDLKKPDGVPLEDKTLIDLVNTDQSTGGAAFLPRNWMKVDYYLNDNKVGDTFSGLGDFVIVYRLIQHRIRLVGNMQWSVTVGFDQKLLPDVGVDDNGDYPDDTYIKFAEILGAEIRNFKDTSINAIQPNGTFIMIDDLPVPEANQGSSKVGKLINLARANCNDKLKHPTLYSSWVDRVEHIPRNEKGEQYPGYKPDSLDINVTTITMLS